MGFKRQEVVVPVGKGFFEDIFDVAVSLAGGNHLIVGQPGILDVEVRDIWFQILPAILVRTMANVYEVGKIKDTGESGT